MRRAVQELQADRASTTWRRWSRSTARARCSTSAPSAAPSTALEQISYPHPDLADILDETYGVIVYQDQVLKIAQKFAGYTLGAADIMRKAMGKKIAAVMQAERERFVNGAIDEGLLAGGRRRRSSS